MRKLPVYLCVDTSESMIGSVQKTVLSGVRFLTQTLRKNPYALETVWLSVITFDSTARVLVPLTDLCEFHAPDSFELQSGTAMGAAFDLLRDRIGKEVVKTTKDVKGDWRPLVFFLTDGAPTDEWSEPLRRLKAVKPKPANIYAIGCGDEVNWDLLKEFSDYAFSLEAKTEDERMELVKKLFIWLSASIASASASAANRDVDDARSSQFGKPEGARVVDASFAPQWTSDYPRYVFLHAGCSIHKKKSLIRYHYDGASYGSVDVFKLPDSFSFRVGAGGAPAVPTSLLTSDPPICPYCGGLQGLICPKCGCVLCVKAPVPSKLECPVCGNVAELNLGGEGLSEISGSLG